MIDLSNAKVGDWYNYSSHGLAKLVALGTEEACFIFEDSTGFLVTDLNGCDSEGFPVVASKIDPRQWLKDMPDAGIFAGRFGRLACDNDGEWWAYANKPKPTEAKWRSGGVFMKAGLLKMPRLTGDQWKDSLISIEELREWQLNNK